MKIATFIRELEWMRGDGRLYQMDPPYLDYEFIIVSAADMEDFGETYIFPANEDGTEKDWGELPGSKKYVLDHAEILRGIGYEPLGGDYAYKGSEPLDPISESIVRSVDRIFAGYVPGEWSDR